MLSPAACFDAELVANAAAASAMGSGIELRLAVVGSTLRIEVCDRAPDAPQRRCADELDEDGRGLFLVDQVTRLWGWHPVLAARSYERSSESDTADKYAVQPLLQGPDFTTRVDRLEGSTS